MAVAAGSMVADTSDTTICSRRTRALQATLCRHPIAAAAAAAAPSSPAAAEPRGRRGGPSPRRRSPAAHRRPRTGARTGAGRAKGAAAAPLAALAGCRTPAGAGTCAGSGGERRGAARGSPPRGAAGGGTGLPAARGRRSPAPGRHGGRGRRKRKRGRLVPGGALGGSRGRGGAAGRPGARRQRDPEQARAGGGGALLGGSPGPRCQSRPGGRCAAPASRHAEPPQQPGATRRRRRRRQQQQPPGVPVPGEPAQPRRPGQPVAPQGVGQRRGGPAARGGLHEAEPLLPGHRPQVPARHRPLGLQAPGRLRWRGLGLGQRTSPHEGRRGFGARHPLAARHLLRALPERQLSGQGGAAQPALRLAAGSRAGGSGERARQAAAAHPQQDGHVRHHLSGQVLLSVRPRHQSRPGLPLCSAPPGPRRPAAGPRGALGSHRQRFKGHAGQAQHDGRALWFAAGLCAVQRGGVLLAVPAQRACPLCALEPLMAGSLPKEEACTLFSKHAQGGDTGTRTHTLDPTQPARISTLAVLQAPGPTLRHLVLSCPPDGLSGRACTGQAATLTVLPQKKRSLQSPERAQHIHPAARC